MLHQNLSGTKRKFYSLLRLKNAYHTDTWGKEKKKGSTRKRTKKATLTKVDGRGLQHLLYENLFIQPQCHDEGAGIVPSTEHCTHPAGCDVHLQLVGVKDHPLVQRVDHQTFCGCSCPLAPWSQRTDTSQYNIDVALCEARVCIFNHPGGKAPWRSGGQKKPNIEAPHRQSGQKKKNPMEKFCIDKVARKALWRQDGRKKPPPWCWDGEVLLGGSGGDVNSLDFCPASLKSLGCFYFWRKLSSQWKVVTVNLRILQCQLYRHFWRPLVITCLATSNNLLFML